MTDLTTSPILTPEALERSFDAETDAHMAKVKALAKAEQDARDKQHSAEFLAELTALPPAMVDEARRKGSNALARRTGELPNKSQVIGPDGLPRKGWLYKSASGNIVERS